MRAYWTVLGKFSKVLITNLQFQISSIQFQVSVSTIFICFLDTFRYFLIFLFFWKQGLKIIEISDVESRASRAKPKKGENPAKFNF